MYKSKKKKIMTAGGIVGCNQGSRKLSLVTGLPEGLLMQPFSVGRYKHT